jgi:GGDEF domain-containing protein
VHLPTILVQSLLVDLTLFLFFVTGWVTRRDRTLYGWISAASLAAGMGCLLLFERGTVPNWVSVWLANSLMLLSDSLIWAGIRSFERRPISVVKVISGIVVFSIACLFPQFYENIYYRIALIGLIVAIYNAAITVEIFRGYLMDYSGVRLVLIAFSTVHTLLSLARVSALFDTEANLWVPGISGALTVTFLLEALLHFVAMAVGWTALERDRTEAVHRIAASTDVLTGILNRRAFVAEATNWIERKGKDAALLLFDLDHFKKINDTFGHAAGDAALVAFSKLVSERIQIANIIAGFNIDASTSNQYPRWYETTLAEAAGGGAPIFGRLGGEEFACLLPHLSMPQGLAIAEDIRRELQALPIMFGNQRILMSVSASVVSTADIGHRLDMMLSSADHALYRAKDAGRNRIEPGYAEPGMVIRHYA